MGIENKNQPRPTAIVSATPTHHSSTPFPPPPSFAMFSITAPVKNQETSTRIQQIEAGYDPTPPPPPPKPEPELKSSGAVNIGSTEIDNARKAYQADSSVANFKKLAALKKQYK